ncbi:hypothetical protein JTE90_028096 [Oedothorax gibbosus]|uniref:CRAL-TRIO domain-containing protein n=1 Tax=Oedothorax gibbosus TaxID=931172 RepID=A0AAV6V8H5_9ARAC|nr:hypothetical protein JTE90_028096 [Oedothorax gibbosus]
MRNSFSVSTMSSRYEELMRAKKFMPFHLSQLSEQMVEKAATELNETPESKEPALKQMRQLLKEDKKLKCSSDDEYLIQFLRARKYDVKKAFALLQNKYKVKKSYSEVYDDCDFDEVLKVYTTGAACCLPYRDEDGCVVVVFKMEKWKPEEFNVVTILSAMTVIILYCIEDAATQICGIRIMVDVKGASLRQLRCLTPRYIQLFSKALRNCLPCRFKGIHIYNESTIFQYIWSILKLFLTEKINKRVHFHGDNQKQLHKFLPKAILPGEYGGDNHNFDSADWCHKELPSFREKFHTILESGYDKS